MNWQTVANVVSAAVGGGLLVAVLNLYGTHRRDRKQRRIEFLSEQLAGLYGPLQFFTNSNAKLFDLVGQFHEAGLAEYGGTSGPENNAAAERRSSNISKTLNISNRYVEQVTMNNKRILQILTDNYSLMELDDAESFAEVLVDDARSATEFDEARRFETPLEIHKHLGDIHFMRDDFIELVGRRFKEKKKELNALLK